MLWQFSATALLHHEALRMVDDALVATLRSRVYDLQKLKVPEGWLRVNLPT